MKNNNQIYWEKNAEKFGASFKSTTKHIGIKKIELSIIESIIKSNFKKNIKVLELGCGNGINLIYLSDKFKKSKFIGIDYSKKMIRSAKKNKKKNLHFFEGDITKINSYKELYKFDLVITNRCLINLKSNKKINFVLNFIRKIIKKNGKVLFLENFVEGHKLHNYLRKLVNLNYRKVAHFNKFINLKNFSSILKKNFIILKKSNYSSLYDLILYILNPSIKKNKILYNSKIQIKLTDLFTKFLKNNNEFLKLNIESGQNYLIFAKKK